MQLSGHKVLITGGGTGIGLAIAREFTSRHNRVMIAGRRADVLLGAARALEGVETATVDLVDESTLRQLVRATAERLGGLTILVNNAGIQYNDDYVTGDPNEIFARVDREITTNLTGLVKLTALAIPLLRQAPASAVVNVSSVLAISPKRSAPVYCATKAAVHSFSQALRYQMVERAPHVRVVELLPPMVDTPMTAGRGKRKLRPEAVASALMRGLETEDLEIAVGRTRAVQIAYRLSRRLVERPLRRR